MKISRIITRRVDNMESIEIFACNARQSGDLAGVFEYTDDAGYFYLYSTDCKGEDKVVDAIFIVSGKIDFSEDEINVVWSKDELMVALFIREKIYAVFDVGSKICYCEKFSKKHSHIPDQIKNSFDFSFK